MQRQRPQQTTRSAQSRQGTSSSQDAASATTLGQSQRHRGIIDTAVQRIIEGSPVDTHHTKRISWRTVRLLTNPVWCYYGFILSVIALSVYGVIMVFSSSTVDLVAQGDSPWSQAINQGSYAFFGALVAGILAFTPKRLYQQLALVAFVGALILQCFTLTSLGVSAGGNTGWIVLGPVRFQPAEILKWSVCVWLPWTIIKWQQGFRPRGLHPIVLPAASLFLAFGTVLAGKDLGSAMIVLIVAGAAFFFGGLHIRYFVYAGVIGVVGLTGLILTGSGNRLARIMATYTQCSEDQAQGLCYQAIHGNYALGSGGFFGVGLGNSREKWNYLPAAFNDFIYAIIGEELGFLGTLAVLLLFIAMCWCLMVIAMRHQDTYARLVIVCITIWLVGQAMVNIGVVVGLLPVMGLPLPFISSGGTAMVMCLAAAGTAIAMARTQDEIRAALAHR